MTSSQGAIDLPDYDIAQTVLASWDAFIALADAAELSRPTRLEGWTVREVVVHLGTWDGRSALTEVQGSLGDADAGTLDSDAFNAEVVAARAGATDEEVLDALRRSRDAAADLLSSEDIAERGRELVTSVTGPMPLLTVLHAGCYELALHALDITDALDRDCDPVLLAHGVAALADSTGCLAARSGAKASVGIIADEAAWSFSSSSDGGWTAGPVTGDPHGPRVSGSAKDLLEASSGRADPVRLVASRRLKIKHLGGLLDLTPIIDQVPGLPGGRALKVAAKSLGGFRARRG